jgi:aminoglycoside phosphotransferase (APT) family kinase protein
MRQDGSLFVVDWTQAAVTDYRFDLGWTLLVIRAFNGEDSRDEVLGAYEHLAGHPVDSSEYFEVVAAAKFLFPILGAFSHGTEAVGMRSAALGQMRACLNQAAAINEFLRQRTGVAVTGVQALTNS